MRGSILREKLRSGDRVYGTHVVCYGGPIAARWTNQLEMDFGFICAEHMPLDRTEISMMSQTLLAGGISPMARIPYPSAHWASMFIDGGAEGIVAPYVETVEQVRELIGAVRYRPIKGKFLRDILDGVRQPTEKMQQFFERFNGNLYLIIGIESVEAINHLEELISFDGVDGVFLGPHDITCSLEIPEEYDNPLFIETVVDVIRRCRKLGKGVGIHMDNTLPRCRPFLEAGANFILNSADVVKMKNSMNLDFQNLRHVFEDSYGVESGKLGPQASCIDQPGGVKR